MNRNHILIAILSFLSALPALGGEPVRGIGIYPGRPSESFAPTLVRDNAYRNVALHRRARHSSSADANLTAQLVTDGVITRHAPCELRVSTPEGVKTDRDREKALDGNIHTRIILSGADSYVQYDWTAMEVAMDEVRINAEAVYHADQARGGYAIEVMASANGKTWSRIGRLQGDGLPGEATRQQASSDPNKNEMRIRLPMRRVNVSVPLAGSGRYRHVRLVFRMEGCAYWRLNETEFRLGGRLQPALPSSTFTSVWVSDGGGEQWLAVDLGSEVEADRLHLHWVEPPRRGEIQASDDGERWSHVADLPRSGKPAQHLRCAFKGRYVRLLLHEAGRSGRYALSELQVMGRGGLTAHPHERKGMADGKYYLDGGYWQLWRKGSELYVPATVPATVLQSYADIGALHDLTRGDNLRLASESYFQSDFIYRTTFDAPAEYSGKRVYLHFDGINWKASVTLNGVRMGRIEGAFMRGRFDVTDVLRPTSNRLEVEVACNANFGAVKWKNTESTDLNGGVLGADNPTFHASIGWDWITSTPGREVGIWDDVYLSATGGIHLSDPLVQTRLAPAPDTLVTLTPSVWVANELGTQTSATVSGWIGGITFAKTVRLAAGEHTEVQFSPDEFPQLKNRNLELWWPSGYGNPRLYEAGFSVAVGEERADSLHYRAGLREVSYAGTDSRLQLFVNHKRFVPLGGNWGFSETNLNYRGREYDIAVRYHRHMHYNMIRNWVGQTGDREFYEACDRHGIMVWQDFWLANPWDGPDPYDERMFMANAADYIRRIRRHPCLAIYVGRNEGYPPASLNAALNRQVAALHPDLGYIPSSADDGVSGHGPYHALEAKDYFARQTRKLHSERGMPCVPTYESLCRMLAPEDRWPIGLGWAQHDFTQQGAQRGASFVRRVTDRFGTPQDARQFCEWAQWVNYDGYRAMYESAQVDRQGLLIWMSHPCWPSTVWQTYDYYLEPTAAYFGVRKACEPLHIQYNADTRWVQVVNTSTGQQCDLEAVVELRDMRGRVLRRDSTWVDVDNDATVDLMPVSIPDTTRVYYLRLHLYDRGHHVSDNFYVLSQHPADWRALASLPKVSLQMRQEFKRVGGQWQGTATLSNPADTPVLLIRLNLKGTDGEQILPVLYSDNYFALMPGERKQVTVSCSEEDVRGGEPRLEVSGFNAGGPENLGRIACE